MILFIDTFVLVEQERQRTRAIFVIIHRFDRCATGESWQAVMLACKAGAECHASLNPRPGQIAPSKSLRCGSDFAYVYFCSFVFLSSFLVCHVTSNLFLVIHTYVLSLSDAQLIRCCHYG
jgi:hypothetical protein